jgi:zinc D-Ala-D-Ala carboxypeptidase
MMTTKLTEHFTLEEMTASQTASRMGINNVPPEGSQERKNLQRTAELMEKVRIVLGEKPVLISSGYRCPQVNAACGGSSTSAHMSGLAVDFTCPGFGTPRDICHALQPLMKDLGIDQLIYEYESWVHLGLSASDPRYMAMTIDNGGTRTGIA